MKQTGERIIKHALFGCLVMMICLSCVHTEPVDSANESMTYSELADLLDTQIQGKDFLLVDVRTPDEYNSGHIPGAVNIPHTVVTEQVPEEFKDRRVIVYCRSGNRSNQAKNALTKAGFTSIVDFGSYTNWKGEFIIEE